MSVRRGLRVATVAVRLLVRAAPGLCALFAALQVLSAAAAAVTLLVVREVLAAVVGGGPAPVGPVLLLGAVLALAAAGSVLQRHVMLLLSEQVGAYAAEQVLAVAAAAELSDFDDPEFHGRLRRAQDADHRPVELTQGLLSVGSSLSVALAVLGVLLAVDPLLVLVVVAAAVPVLLASAALSRGLFELTVAIVRADLRRRYVRELLTARTAAAEVRAFGMAGPLRAAHRRLVAERLVELRRVLRRGTAYGLLGSLGTSLGVALGGVLLVRAVADGRLTLATAATAVAALLQVVPLLGGIAGNAAQVYEDALFLDDYEAFRTSGLLDRPAGGPVPAGFDRVVVDGVTFRYPGAERDALAGVSLSLGRGEVVAVVGENGSGKSTLAKLVAGLYPPSAGVVRWDAADVAAMDPGAYRRKVAVAFQDFGRYQFTAAENIDPSRLGGGGPLDDVVAAARQAGADGFVRRLPEGYGTVLSRELADGVDLSGGQWQRLALARAFHRDAPLVVLDEPTAALDAVAEAELFDRIRDLLAGRTVLLVSHRFCTVRGADRIVVLDRGRVAETGDHDTLMALDGAYARMFRLQAAAYLTPAGPAPRR